MDALFYKKKKPLDLPEALAPLADTHTHVGLLPHLTAPEAQERAYQAGVRLMVVPIDPTEDIQDAQAYLDMIDSWESAYSNSDLTTRFLVGAHPYGAQLFSDNHIRCMEDLLRDKRFVGVGEIGLDYNAEGDPELQKKVFREQLALAREADVPVELHLRNAKDDEHFLCHADAYAILKADGFPKAGCVLHCFTATAEVMHPFCDLGCYIAFGGASTFKSAPYIRQAFLECPEHLILSETDAPYMAPVPLRGQDCEPAMVAFVVSFLADLCEEAHVRPRKATYDALWRNAQRLFMR